VTASVRFIAVGDTGKANTGQNQVGAAMATVCAAQGCDFAVLLGDNFYPTGVSGTMDPQWQTAFVTPYANVNIPFYAVLGNHDYGGDGAGYELQQALNQIAYAQVNPKWKQPGRHYKWSQGGVDFFGADTNASMWGTDQMTAMDFGQWVPASTAPWKIAFGHHPYRSNGPHGNAGAYEGIPGIPIVSGGGVKTFLDNHVCGRADVYLSGHDHTLQWLVPTCTRPNGVQTQLIVSGGGASFTEVDMKNMTHYQAARLGFFYVVISGNTFTGTFYSETGAVLFTRTFTK